MAKKGIKHYSPLDLLGNELLNFKAEELETDPSGTGLWKGRFWYNAVENVYKGYDGVKVTKFGSPEATNIDGLEAWILANVSINDLKAQKADYSANGFKIINLATPTDAKDAVNKEYVDAIGQGFITLDPVRAASTANIDTTVSVVPTYKVSYPVDMATSFNNDLTKSIVLNLEGSKVYKSSEAVSAPGFVLATPEAGLTRFAAESPLFTDARVNTVGGFTKQLYIPSALLTVGTYIYVLGKNEFVGADESIYFMDKDLMQSSADYGTYNPAEVNVDGNTILCKIPVTESIKAGGLTIYKKNTSQNQYQIKSIDLFVGNPEIANVTKANVEANGTLLSKDAENNYSVEATTYKDSVTGSVTKDITQNGKYLVVCEWSEVYQGYPTQLLLGEVTPVAGASTNKNIIKGLKTIDGVDLVEGDRVLLKNQTNKAGNGIFIASVNEWVRSNDFDDMPVKEVKTGAYTYVREGNQSGSGWTVTSAGTIVLGVSDIVWKQFSQAGQVKAGKGIIVVGGEVSAKVDESTITLNAEDKIAVKEGGITSKELGDASVETSKIKDAAVTKEKIADGSVETSKIATGAVTAEKLGGVVGEGATKDAEGKIAVDKTKVAFLDEAQELTNKTMDFGVDGKNIATNIPESALETVATSKDTRLVRDADGKIISEKYKFKGSIVGDGAKNDFEILHNLESTDVFIEIYNAVGDKDTVEVYRYRPSANAVNVNFTLAPAIGENYTVLIMKM